MPKAKFVVRNNKMKTENKMYSERPKCGNIAVMRYCNFRCSYCGFQKFQKISKCQDCRDNKNHSHLEVLSRTPPKTKPGEFLTVGLSGDVSFMEPEDFQQVINYCLKWSDRKFLIQSKSPEFFLQFGDIIPDNVIIGTTIESNENHWYNTAWGNYLPYSKISKAPHPDKRAEAMVMILNCRKSVTIEPILDFDLIYFRDWIKAISPEFVYIGYANDKHEGKKLKLPEPPLEKTMRLINELRQAGVEVREKTLRKAWFE